MNCIRKMLKLIGVVLFIFGVLFVFQVQMLGLVYVLNQNGGIVVIDLVSLEIIGLFDVGVKGLCGFGVMVDGKYLVMVNKDDVNVLIIDFVSCMVIKQVKVGKNFEFVWVLGDKVFVIYELSFKGGLLLKLGEVVIEVLDDDDDVLVCIVIIDIKKGKVFKEIISGLEMEGIEFFLDGKKMIVINEVDNMIMVYDIKSGKLLKIVLIKKYGDWLCGIKIFFDGKIYVVIFEFGNKLFVLNEKFDLFWIVDIGKMFYGVVFDNIGKCIFVVVLWEKILQVFDVVLFEKIKDILIGECCWYFIFMLDNWYILLVCGWLDEVVVIDVVMLEVIKCIVNKGLVWGVVIYLKVFGSFDQF